VAKKWQQKSGSKKVVVKKLVFLLRNPGQIELLKCEFARNGFPKVSSERFQSILDRWKSGKVAKKSRKSACKKVAKKVASETKFSKCHISAPGRLTELRHSLKRSQLNSPSF
jgi:hypothetical protein